MISRYVKSLFRNLANHKGTALLNASGLALGISIFVILMQFSFYEESIDQFHRNASKIFQVTAKMNFDGTDVDIYNMSAQFGPSLKETVPGVAEFCRVKRLGRVSVSSNQRDFFYEEPIIFADPQFLDIFDFSLLQGQRNEVLKAANQAAVTPDFARKYFGEESPIGKSLILENGVELLVTGLVEAPPNNSSIQYRIICSFSTVRQIESKTNGLDADNIPYDATYVGVGAYQTYVVLTDDAPNTKDRVEKIIPSLVVGSGFSMDNTTYMLASLPELHAKTSVFLKYKVLILAIGFCILIVAAFNFISLSISQILNRAKESILRSIHGAQKRSLIVQYYVETSFMVSLVLIASIGIIEFLRRYLLKGALNIALEPSQVYNVNLFMAMLALLVFVVTLSGSFPALVFASFRPLDILKGKIGLPNRRGTQSLQKWFAIAQFSLCGILTICSLGIYRQVNFLLNYDHGINDQQMVVIPFENMSPSAEREFRAALGTIPGIQNVSSASIPLFNGYTNIFSTKSVKSNTSVSVAAITVSANFIKDLGLKWKTKPESPSQLVRSDYVIINEKAVATLELEENPIGQEFMAGGSRYKVAGVLQDFHLQSLHKPVDPLMVSIQNDTASVAASLYVYASLTPNVDIAGRLHEIRRQFQNVVPNKPFDYYFTDDAKNKLYMDDTKIARLFFFTTVIAVILAVVGLLSYCSFALELKRKEIGIRKFLGAGLGNLLFNSLAQYLLPIVASFLVAVPIAWIALDKIFQQYAYKITIGPSIMISALSIATVVALATIMYKLIPALLVSPLKFIREE